MMCSFEECLPVEQVIARGWHGLNPSLDLGVKHWWGRHRNALRIVFEGHVLGALPCLAGRCRYRIEWSVVDGVSG